MSRISPQLLVFSYHKSGTSLFLHVMTKVCHQLGLTLANHYGLVDRLDLEPDVILLPHSLLRAPLDRPYRAIRLIRDPRDIWVSGYLYHLRCDEEWCRNTDLDSTPPIRWPQVDYSVAHWPEDWKRRYLERLNGQSYQQNLVDRSLADGLSAIYPEYDVEIANKNIVSVYLAYSSAYNPRRDRAGWNRAVWAGFIDAIAMSGRSRDAADLCQRGAC